MVGAQGLEPWTRGSRVRKIVLFDYAPDKHKFKVFNSRPQRRVTGQIKRGMRRPAFEPAIGDMKAERRMGRNQIARAQDDAIGAGLAAIGYDFRRHIAWQAPILAALCAAVAPKIDEPNQLVTARAAFFTAAEPAALTDVINLSREPKQSVWVAGFFEPPSHHNSANATRRSERQLFTLSGKALLEAR